MSSEPQTQITQIQAFQDRARKQEAELRELMLDVRQFLDHSDLGPFYDAESDLYDALDCLQDFMESCGVQIDELEADSET